MLAAGKWQRRRWQVSDIIDVLAENVDPRRRAPDADRAVAILRAKAITQLLEPRPPGCAHQIIVDSVRLIHCLRQALRRNDECRMMNDKLRGRLAMRLARGGNRREILYKSSGAM